MDDKKDVHHSDLEVVKHQKDSLPSWDELKYFVRKYYLFLLVIALVPVTLFSLGQQLANRSSAAPLLKLGPGGKVGVQGGGIPSPVNYCILNDKTYEKDDKVVGSCGYNRDAETGATTRTPTGCKQCIEVTGSSGYKKLDWTDYTCIDDSVDRDLLDRVCPLTQTSCAADGGLSTGDQGYGWYRRYSDCRQCQNGRWGDKIADTAPSTTGYQSPCGAAPLPTPTVNITPGVNTPTPYPSPTRNPALTQAPPGIQPTVGAGGTCSGSSPTSQGCYGVAYGGDCTLANYKCVNTSSNLCACVPK